MIKITDTIEDSIAQEIGFEPGDELISINNHEITDFLDYQFHQSEEELELQIKDKNSQDINTLQIEKDFDEDLGLVLESPKVKTCKNNCTFCFIKQNPKGMRRAIYFCDEDYRYSFLYGNFITLTDLSEQDLNRIAEQRLSPLYISVHATDPDARKKLFRYKGDDRLMEKIEFLSDNRIDLHTQIVLVPGVNDGKVLDKTVFDLYQYEEVVKTVGIVPVGLTKHREKLPQIEPVSDELAQEIVNKSNQWQQTYINNEGSPFVTIADEFFLQAGAEIPDSDYYGPYYQIENGIGLCRDMIDLFIDEKEMLPESLDVSRNILLVTGKSAESVIKEHIVEHLNKINNLNVDIIGIENNYYGKSVTVAGLITGQDIIEQLQSVSGYDHIFLPPRIVNHDNLLPDDLTAADIEKALKIPVSIASESYLEIIENVSQ